MKGAPLTLPTFSTPEFGEFFRLGRAIRVILPLAKQGSIAHLFVVYGYQGSSDDPQKLLLTNKLFEAVIGEAKVCGTGQPVIITGDFNVEPDVVPVIAKALQFGHLIDLEAAYSTGRGKLVLSLPVDLLWMVLLAPVGIFPGMPLRSCCQH